MGHQTRKWTAQESTDLVGSRYLLTVNGEFESLRSNEHASLAEASPQGINPKILILDMVVSSTGLGSDVVQWKAVEPFSQEISARQYTHVTIRYGDGNNTVEVEEILS